MKLAVQFPRYIAVSVVALAVDMLVFLGLDHLTGAAVFAGIVGYSIGLVVHYALSRRFVFLGPTDKTPQRLFGEFAASGLTGLAVTAAIISLLHDGFAVPAIIAKAVAVGASFIAVYVLRRRFVFSPPPAA